MSILASAKKDLNLAEHPEENIEATVSFDEKVTALEALHHIQIHLNAPKNQYNSYGNYHYRSCEDILAAVKPLLEETKCVLTLTDHLEMIGERFYIRAEARLHHIPSSTSISNFAYAREAEKQGGMSESQVTGSASTYARKYALNGLFALDDTKIDATKDPDTQPKDRLQMLRKKMQEDGITEEKICALYKVKKLEDLKDVHLKNIEDHWSDIKESK